MAELKMYQLPDGTASAYIAGSAEGAIENGKRVVKIITEAGDSTPDGTEGTVVSSISCDVLPEADRVLPGGEKVDFMYFVEWDNRPGVYVACSDYKLKGADG